MLAELRIALLALERELALERTELEPVPELALERTALELEKEFELLEGLLLLTEAELLPEEEELELRLTCCAPERVLVSVPDVEAELRTAPEVRVALELRVTLELCEAPERDPELTLEREEEALERTADELERVADELERTEDELLLVLCCWDDVEELRDPLLERVWATILGAETTDRAISTVAAIVIKRLIASKI